MSRTIDADALIEDCKRYLGTLNPDRDGKECTRIHWLIGVLANASTIEPRCEACEAFNKTRLLIPQPERTGRWINHVEDGYVECPFCHSATNCDDNISELHFCFSCGARMEGGQE